METTQDKLKTIKIGITQDELKTIAGRLEEEHKRLRRRIEDALRKTASLEELKEIARLLGVKI